MTYKVSAAIVTAKTAVAVGQPAAAGYRASILDAATNAIVSTQDVTDLTNDIVFTGIPQGDYVFRAVRLDVNNAELGNPYTQNFVANDTGTGGDTVLVDTPSGATITVTSE